MYSKELEELIDSVLADGVVTDQERAVLRKRALACGEDPDEVMIVVDGRLAKMKKSASPAIPATEKRGNIVKCPNCGAPIEAGAVKCKECGYVFSNVKANNTAKEFAFMLDKKIAKVRYDGDKTNINKVNEFIKNFPLPTSKEDMLEFMASLDARRRSQSYYQEAYNAKYKECVTKAKIQFAGDTQIEALLNETKISSGKQTASWIWKHKIAIIIAIVAIFFVKSCVLDTSWWDESSADRQWKEVTEAIKQDNKEDVISKLGTANPYSVEDHQGEISSYVRKLVKKGDIDGAKDVVNAANAHFTNSTDKIYVSEPLYDYYMEKGDIEKASRYEKPESLMDDLETSGNKEE